MALRCVPVAVLESLELVLRLTRKKTALDRGRTDCISLTYDLWPWPMTLTFNPLRAMVMTYLLAKVQTYGRSVSKIEWKQMYRQTDRRTEVIALPPTLMQSVKMCITYIVLFQRLIFHELTSINYCTALAGVTCCRPVIRRRRRDG